MTTRGERLKILCDTYGAGFDGRPGRYAPVVCWLSRDGMHEAGYVETFDTFDEAAEHIAGQIIDGWAPEGIFDLDTGDLIEIHVSTPIVTRSEDQGVMQNPLRPE